MINENRIFKILWDNRLHFHAPIYKYKKLLTNDEINYLLCNDYLTMIDYKDTKYYQLTKKGFIEMEIANFGLWKYLEVIYLHSLGKIRTWFINIFNKE